LSSRAGRAVMADKSTEKAQQTAREAEDTASEAVGKATDIARNTAEVATNGYEELLTLSRHNMEGMSKAGQAMLKGASDLGSLWASFWNEQMTTGVEAMRSLAESDSWDQALKVQNDFTRSSFDRVCSRAVKSTEVTAEMLTSSLVPRAGVPHAEPRSACPGRRHSRATGGVNV
jgi:hypothetical protein